MLEYKYNNMLEKYRSQPATTDKKNQNSAFYMYIL